ncbi:unnamed protein product [Caenorhabditis angaria]|uniref:Uncharacterized protein n=1 Tax=Caenorhabditis angaria TaxID=860376 RepID=A0A9P1MXP0_9PELO|nr:unnamed protein product [Caenorhabditis angaria]
MARMERDIAQLKSDYERVLQILHRGGEGGNVEGREREEAVVATTPTTPRNVQIRDPPVDRLVTFDSSTPPQSISGTRIPRVGTPQPRSILATRRENTPIRVRPARRCLNRRSVGPVRRSPRLRNQ